MPQPRTSPPDTLLDLQVLDRLPLPTAILRDNRYIYANDAMLGLLGYAREEFLGLPFDAPVAPVDLERVRARRARRLRGEAEPTTYELSVQRTDGTTRRVELFLAQVGTDTLLQLYDVTSRFTRNENLRALARLGAAVTREFADEAIFDAVGRGLAELEAVVLRLAPDGTAVRVIAVPGAPARLAPFAAQLTGTRHPWTTEVEDAWTDGFLFLDDAGAALANFAGPEHEAVALELVVAEGLTHGALVRLEMLGRPAELLLVLAPWVRGEDQATLTMFGGQISAALDAARVVTDLSRRNAELTALNHVATAAGSARELEELFDRAAKEVGELTGCSGVALYLLEGDEARLVHAWGGPGGPATSQTRLPLADSPLQETVSARKPQVWTGADLHRSSLVPQGEHPHRTVVSLPLIARSRVLGIFNAAWEREREVPQHELALLAAMAVHLAAAVQTHGLVDDLRRSYDDLSRTQAQLVQRERLAALGEMAAAVAHEVRNPLAVIFNSLSTMRRLPVRDDTLMAMLQEEAERIDHLVSDLLDLARPTLPSLSTGVELVPLLKEALGSVLRQAGAPVQLSLEDDLHTPDVLMDARMIRQAFVNVAGNAVQAMPLGGRLAVRVSRENGGGADWVRVAFQDSGHGIPPHVKARIFEPFYTTRARGTGLGLTLVKRIVEGHRGDVTVDSEPGAGTQVVLRWPVG